MFYIPIKYGFREGISIPNAMFSLLNDVSRALDCRGHVYGLFLALSNAFEVVNHALLLHKLELIGLRGKVYLSGSYIFERRQ